MTIYDIIGYVLYTAIGAGVTYIMTPKPAVTPANPLTPLLPTSGGSNAANIVNLAETIAMSVVQRLLANGGTIAPALPVLSAPTIAGPASSMPYPVSLTLSDGHTVSLVNGVLTVTQTAPKVASPTAPVPAAPTIHVGSAA